MLTVIYGRDLKLVNSELKKFLNGVLDHEIQQLKSPATLSDFYLLSMQSSLFAEPKAYIFYGDDILISLEEFNSHEQTLNQLLTSTKNTILVTTKKPSSASKVTSFLKQANYIEVKELTEKNKYNYIKDLITKKNIYLSSDELDLLVSKLPLDANVIEHELNKLFNYSSIDIDVIKHLICDYKQITIFELVSHCFHQDLTSAISNYERFFKTDPDLNYIIHMMALQTSQLLVFYQLKSQGYDYQKICDVLQLNYYGYKNIDRLLTQQSISNIYMLVDYLYDLDIKLKRNLIDKNHAFKYFLLKLFK